MAEKTQPKAWYRDLPKDILPFLLFLLLPMFAFPELFFRQDTLYRADLTWIHYPLHVLAAEQWKSGIIPLWNPYVLSGAPLLAGAQIGVLQPLGLIFLLPIPPYRALTLFVTLQFTLAATFTYVLARSLAASRAGAALAGLSFGFGGFLMAQVTNLNVVTGAIWLPLVFFGGYHALHTRRWAVAVLAGVPIALQIVSSHPQVALQTILILLGYVVYQSIRIAFFDSESGSRATAIAKTWGLMAVMMITGLALAAPQIVPFLEMQQYTAAHSAELGPDHWARFSLPAVHWITLLVPSAFGNNVTPSFQGAISNFEEPHVYAGILPLVLAFFSWRSRRCPVVLFLWIALLVSALLAMGYYTPAHDLLGRLPGFPLLGAPSRWTMMVNLSLAVLAAIGFDSFVKQGANRKLRLALVGLWLLIVAGVAVIWIFRQPILDWTGSFDQPGDLVHTIRLLVRRGLFEIPDGYNQSIILKYLAWDILPSIALISRLGIAVILMIAYATKHLSAKTFATAAIALVAIDMSLAGGTAVNQVTAASHWQQISGGARYVLDELDDSPYRFFAFPNGSEADVVAGLKQHIPNIHQVPASGGHSSLGLARFDKFRDETHPLIMLSLTGTQLALNKGRLTADAESVLPLVYQDDEWYVYQNPAPLPRAFVVHQALTVPDQKEAIHLLKDRYFEVQEVVILETDEHLPELAGQVPYQESVAIVNETPNSIRLQVNMAGPGYLVLLDNYYPGWQASIDRSPVPILPANAYARAIYVEEGHHTIQFDYKPISIRIGMGLCVAGLLGLIAAVRSEWNRAS